jgi:hypothetical protein
LQQLLAGHLVTILESIAAFGAFCYQIVTKTFEFRDRRLFRIEICLRIRIGGLFQLFEDWLLCYWQLGIAGPDVKTAMTETKIDCFREMKTCVLATADNMMGRPHVFHQLSECHQVG